VKILTWDRNGFWLPCKRLERGTFERIPFRDGARARAELSRVQLAMLLEGVALDSAKSKKHFVSELRLGARDGDGERDDELADRAAR